MGLLNDMKPHEVDKWLKEKNEDGFVVRYKKGVLILTTGRISLHFYQKKDKRSKKYVYDGWSANVQDFNVKGNSWG